MKAAGERCNSSAPRNSMSNATRDIAVLEDAAPYHSEASRLAEVEPAALAEVAHKLTGGLRYRMMKTGDCQLYPASGAHGGAGGRNLSL